MVRCDAIRDAIMIHAVFENSAMHEPACMLGCWLLLLLLLAGSLVLAAAGCCWCRQLHARATARAHFQLNRFTLTRVY
jgi:hypothetical protein